jgi:hypothetical protein
MTRGRLKSFVRTMGVRLGWQVDTSGRKWSVTHPGAHHGGLSYAPLSLAAIMIRALTTPHRFGGDALTTEEIRDMVPDGHRPTSTHGLPAHDEGTLFKVWPEMTE